jgi:hypothetical protein
MPYLFCAEHGKEHEATSQAEQENYRLLGETVLIVKGRLISGPWRCDRCGTRLKKGNPACLVTAFSSLFAVDLCDLSMDPNPYEVTEPELLRA